MYADDKLSYLLKYGVLVNLFKCTQVFSDLFLIWKYLTIYLSLTVLSILVLI